VLLGLVEASIRILFYFRVVDYKIVVVVIRDNVCYHFGLPFSLVCPLLLWVSLSGLRSGLFLLFALSVPVRPTDALLLAALVISFERPLEDDLRAISLLLFKRISVGEVDFVR